MTTRKIKPLVVRNRPSASARSLARALDSKVNRWPATGTSRLPRYAALVNWGCSRLPVVPVEGQRLLNSPAAVASAKNKLDAFRLFREHNVPHPAWWTYATEVVRGGILLARTNLTGSGGDGIVVVRDGEAPPQAPLYVAYVRKTAEYRIHVFRGRVICVQQKRLENDAEQTADQKLLRNRANGWVFAVNDVQFSTEEQRNECNTAAINAVSCLGLDFGAVDLVVGKRDGRPYVLEVNTAPGIESPTVLNAYREAVETYLNA